MSEEAKIELWFPTPVMYLNTPEELYQEIIAEYEAKESEIRKTTKQGTWDDNIETSDINGNLLETFNLPKLRNRIESAALKFSNDVMGVNSVSLVGSWANYNSKYQHQDIHIHTPNRISAVFYMRTTENCGEFRISPPSRTMNCYLNAPQMFQNGYIQYKPRNGMLLIFPSWVPHGVRSNMSDETRLSIAVNFN